MSELKRRELEEHNRRQQQYFGRSEKRTMVPKDSPYIQRHVRELLSFLELPLDARILEVGCGRGRYTLPLAKKGLKLEGLDLTPELLRHLHESDGGRYNIPLHCADIVEHPTHLDGHFDAVIALFTLHHFHDLSACFVAMARLLKPGGRVVCLEPNAYNPLYYLQILLTPGMTWEGDRGIAQMRPAVIFNAMRDAGLQRPVMRRFGFFPPFLTNRRWGARFESMLERISIWQSALPFQLFRGEKPTAAEGSSNTTGTTGSRDRG